MNRAALLLAVLGLVLMASMSVQGVAIPNGEEFADGGKITTTLTTIFLFTVCDMQLIRKP